jgi:hypothetical protein
MVCFVEFPWFAPTTKAVVFDERQDQFAAPLQLEGLHFLAFVQVLLRNPAGQIPLAMRVSKAS